MRTFIELITETAKTFPEALAITHGENSINYENLLKNIKKIHHGAIECGLKKGDNVLFVCKPDVEGLSLALGLLHAGITVSIVDPFTSNDLFLNRCKSAGVTHVIAPGLFYTISKHSKLAKRFMKMQVANIGSLNVKKLMFGSSFGNSKYDLKKWLKLPETPEVEDMSDEASPAVIVFTSGTTSEPKGVVHSYGSLSASIDETASELEIDAFARVCSEPMTIGLVALSKGAEWIIPIKGKSIPDCNIWFGTPKDILEGLELMEKEHSYPKRLYTVAIGAAPVLPSLVARIQRVIPKPEMRIKNVYGMTEMLPIAIGNAKFKHELMHLGDYIGKPLSNASVSIAPDGEVLISGTGLMKGYTSLLGDSNSIREVSPLATGDIGEIMDNGHILLKGRKKDMFIRGSMNVYPGLYEPSLSSIEGVEQAVIVGIPDSYGDDEIVLAVQPQFGMNCKVVKQRVEAEMSQHMDKDAIPTEVIIVDKMPLSGRANKLDRKELLDLIKWMRASDE